MSIKVSSSGNFDNKKNWKRLKKHFEHDSKIRHKNEYLNTTESQTLRVFNQHKTFMNYGKLIHSVFDNYIESHDYGISKKRKFNSVENLFAKKSTNPDLCYTVKLGDEESWHEFLNRATSFFKSQGLNPVKEKAKLYKTISSAFIAYGNDFNKANTINDFHYTINGVAVYPLNLTEAYTHLDEMGAPHMHSHVIPVALHLNTERTGYDLSKRPTVSLNKILQELYGSRDSRANLRAFRKKEDTRLIDTVNEGLKKDFPNMYEAGIKFEFIRKKELKPGIVTGISHEEYKHNQQVMDEQKKQLQAQQQQIEEQSEALSKLSSLLGPVKTLREKIKKLKRKYDNLYKLVEKTQHFTNEKDIRAFKTTWQAPMIDTAVVDPLLAYNNKINQQKKYNEKSV